MIRGRSLLALTAGELISQLGSSFSALALPWFVPATTHSSTRMGIVFAVELVPFVLFGLPRTSRVSAPRSPRSSATTSSGSRGRTASSRERRTSRRSPGRRSPAC